MKCKICSSDTSAFGSATLLNKYDVHYYRCDHCGFVQTEAPYWLEEAYQTAVARSDVGLVRRNVTFAVVSRAIISFLFDLKAAFVDYGGGYGLFVRLMRDAGFDFYWIDKYCPNLFAKGFEAHPGSGEGRYELLTAFEVFEHMVHPLEEIEQMLRLSKNILFSTELIPREEPKPGEWWYYAPEDGQHISFFTLDSLAAIGKKFRMNLYSNGRTLHLLTPKKIPASLFKLISLYPVAWVLQLFRRQPSLLERDHQGAVSRMRG